MLTRFTPLALACALLLILVSPGHAQEARLGLGDIAPDHSLKTFAGKTVNLSDYAGRKLVIAFMVPGSGACHSIAPLLEREIWQKLKGQSVGVLGVLVRARRAQRFATGHSLSFPVAVDAALVRRFNSDGYPFVVVLDGSRKLIYTSRKKPADSIIPALKKLLG